MDIIINYCPFCGKKLKKYEPEVFAMWVKYCKKCQYGFRWFKNGNQMHWDKFDYEI